MGRLSQIQVFILVAEKMGVNSAAQELGISPAAVSKQVTRLESDLGVQLMNRSTRKVELTEIGAQYLEHCKRVVEEVNAADSLISQIQSEPTGSLRIVSSRHFAYTYIIPHLKEFMQLYPMMQVNLELAERVPDLEKEKVDILIGMSVSANENSIQRKIASSRYSLCASPKYLKEHGTPKHPRDLVKHRFITHSIRKPDNEVELNNGEIIQIHPYMRLNDSSAIAQLALEGLGIAKLHEHVVHNYLRSGDLVEVLPQHVGKEVPLFVAYPPSRYVSSKIRCFIDFILSKMPKRMSVC